MRMMIMRKLPRTRNKYEVASLWCSIAIVLFPFIGYSVFHLFPKGSFSAIALTIPLGIIPGVLAWLGRSLRCGILAFFAAFSPVFLLWISYYVFMILYIVSGGRIKPV